MLSGSSPTADTPPRGRSHYEKCSSHHYWGLGGALALRSVRTISTLTRASSAAIAPSAARTGAMSVNAPPTTTPAVSGTSSSFSSSGVRKIKRRTLPSSISSLVLSTSSLPAISICSVQVCSSSALARSTSLSRSLMVLSLLSRHPILPSIVTFAALVLLSWLSRPVVEDRRYPGTSCSSLPLPCTASAGLSQRRRVWAACSPASSGATCRSVGSPSGTSTRSAPGSTEKRNGATNVTSSPSTPACTLSPGAPISKRSDVHWRKRGAPRRWCRDAWCPRLTVRAPQARLHPARRPATSPCPSGGIGRAYPSVRTRRGYWRLPRRRRLPAVPPGVA